MGLVVVCLGFDISRHVFLLSFGFLLFFFSTFFFFNKTFNIRSVSVSSAKSTFCCGGNRRRRVFRWIPLVLVVGNVAFFSCSSTTRTPLPYRRNSKKNISPNRITSSECTQPTVRT